MRVDGDALLRLAERIHLVPGGEVTWEQVLRETSRLLDCRASFFTVYDLQTFALENARQDALCLERIEQYKSHYVKIDRGVSFVKKNPCARLFQNADYMSLEEMDKDEHVQDFLVPQDIKYFAAAISLQPDNKAVTLAPQRAPQQGPFEAQELALLGAIAPHFFHLNRLTARTKAVGLCGQLTTSALEQLRYPALIVDCQLELLWANDRARALLRADGALALFNRCLYARRSGEQRRLRALVQAACQPGLAGCGGAVALSGEEGAPFCSLFVSPLHVAQDDALLVHSRRRRFALLLAQECHPQDPGPLDFLRQLYGLSAQERRLTERLAAGRDLRSASSDLGIGYETARQYLKAVFGKTGTRSQSQLLRLILESPGRMVAPRGPVNPQLGD